MNLYAYVGNDPINATDPTGKYASGVISTPSSWWRNAWYNFGRVLSTPFSGKIQQKVKIENSLLNFTYELLEENPEVALDIAYLAMGLATEEQLMEAGDRFVGRATTNATAGAVIGRAVSAGAGATFTAANLVGGPGAEARHQISNAIGAANDLSDGRLLSGELGSYELGSFGQWESVTVDITENQIKISATSIESVTGTRIRRREFEQSFNRN